MSDYVTSAVAFVTGTVGWLTLEFVGRPFRRFYDLRGEIIQQLVEAANIRARYKEAPDSSSATSGEVEALDLSRDEIERLEDAKRDYRKLAARMSAFSDNETIALWLAKTLGYDPAKASAGLIGISNSLDTYTKERAFHRKTLAGALKLRNVPGLPPG